MTQTPLPKQTGVSQQDKELERLVWEKAKSQNTIAAYDHYLEEYPLGKYKAEAWAMIKKTEDLRKRLRLPAIWHSIF